MKRINTFVLALFLILGVSSVNATNYYVDGVNGNDANWGKTTGAAWKTIQKAANTIQAGDTCFVAPGSYPERISISTSGAAGAPRVFMAKGAGTVTKGFTILANYITVDGFEVTETSRTDWVNGTGFHIVGQYVRILNNYIHITYREGIRLGTDPTSAATSNCLIKGNRMIRCGQSGILMNGQNNIFEGNEIAGTVQWAVTNPQGLDAVGMRFFGSGHVIRNNYIHDVMLGDPENSNAPHVDAVQTWGPATYITIEQNTFSMGEPTLNKQIAMIDEVTAPVNDIMIRNNVCYSTLRGFNILGSYSSTPSPIENVTVVNNTFADFLDNPVEFHDCPNLKLMNNIFYNTKDIYTDTKTLSSTPTIGYNCYFTNNGTQLSGTHYTGDIWGTDPKFVNAAGRDYQLQQTSPVIDKGITFAQVTNDKKGVSRPQGTAYDMGAYEYASAGSTPTAPPAPTDVTPPSVTGASLGSSTTLTITFSEKLSPAGVSSAANYTISGGIRVRSAVLSQTLDKIILTTSKHRLGTTYTVIVNNIKDQAGNIVSPTANSAQYQSSSWGSAASPDSAATDITDGNSTAPDQFQLNQNYPNPFNPSTSIKYSLPQAAFVSLKVYDILGKEVATLVNEQKAPGSYEVSFQGGSLASGIYIYQLKAGTFEQVRKMILSK
ncbi:MAG: choice-of-anchor Q domain-containing protein [Ignavibacteriales bacterium]